MAGGQTELILIIAIGAAIFLFKDQITEAIGNIGGGGTDNSGTQPDQATQSQQMAQTVGQNTYGGATAIGAYPYPIAAAPLNYNLNLLPYPYPIYNPYPYYYPFFPFQFPRPRRFFPPGPHPGPRFLGPPVRPPVVGHFAAPRRLN